MSGAADRLLWAWLLRFSAVKVKWWQCAAALTALVLLVVGCAVCSAECSLVHGVPCAATESVSCCATECGVVCACAMHMQPSSGSELCVHAWLMSQISHRIVLATCLPNSRVPMHVLQVAKGVTTEQISGIFSPYGQVVDLNVMPPKKDGAMGALKACPDLAAHRLRQLNPRMPAGGSAAAEG